MWEKKSEWFSSSFLWYHAFATVTLPPPLPWDAELKNKKKNIYIHAFQSVSITQTSKVVKNCLRSWIKQIFHELNFIIISSFASFYASPFPYLKTPSLFLHYAMTIQRMVTSRGSEGNRDSDISRIFLRLIVDYEFEDLRYFSLSMVMGQPDFLAAWLLVWVLVIASMSIKMQQLFIITFYIFLFNFYFIRFSLLILFIYISSCSDRALPFSNIFTVIHNS